MPVSIDINTKQRRYLIAGPSWIGDMVMAQSLFITLKQQYPDCLIDVLAPAWSLPILNRMPEVNEGISADVSHGEFSFFKRRKLGLSLRAKQYSHAIVMPRSWKSALIPYFAGIPIRTGYRGEMRYGLLNDIRGLNKQVMKQTVQRYVAHAGPNNPDTPPKIPFPSLQVSAENQKKLIARFGLKLDRPVVCMMPGAEYGPAKQWPVEYYKNLAKSLLAADWNVWVLGSEKDKATGDVIADGNNVYNLCGKTELDGSSTPEYTPPLSSEEKRKIFYLGLDCSPCFNRVCPLGHTDCLNKIKDEDVYRSITGRS
jgi:heptosyltransferase-2